MLFDQLVPVLQLATGPVILISGAGLVLLSMTNRLGRVIDRSRILADSLHNQGSNRRHLDQQLEIMVRRARLLRVAIALNSLCLLLAALLIIALFLIALFGGEAASLIIVLFISCMVSLIGGLVVFLFDVNVSLSALKVEVEFDTSQGG